MSLSMWWHWRVLKHKQACQFLTFDNWPTIMVMKCSCGRRWCR